MNAAKFMAALNTVEQDHELVLGKVQALKETVGCLLDPDGVDAKSVLGRLGKLHAFFATQFQSHMEEEETTLFPLLEQFKPEGAELVVRLRQEHAAICRRREQFGDCLAIAEGLEGGPPRMVLRDLLAYGWELWELLDNHAHVETQAVRQCLARSFVNGAAAP